MSEKRLLRGTIAAAMMVSAPLGFACTTNNWVDQSGTPHSGVSGVIEAGDVPIDGYQVYEDSCSLGVTPDGSARFVEDGSPSDEARFIARFYLLLSELTWSSGDSVVIFSGFNPSDGEEFSLEIQNNLGDFDLVAQAGGTSDSFTIPFQSPVASPLTWTVIELDWDAAGTNMDVAINGSPAISLTPASPGNIEYVRLGDVNGDLGGAGSVGIAYFDAYASRRSGSPGFARPGDANLDGASNVIDKLIIQSFINAAAASFPPADCNNDAAPNVIDKLCVQAIINAGG